GRGRKENTAKGAEKICRRKSFLLCYLEFCPLTLNGIGRNPNVISSIRHHPFHCRVVGTQIIGVHRKLHLLMFSRPERDPRKPFQFSYRTRSRSKSVMHVELNYFSAFAFPVVGNIGRNAQNSRRVDAGRFHMNIGVFKGRVRESVSKRKQRFLAFELISGMPAVWRSRSSCALVTVINRNLAYRAWPTDRHTCAGNGITN